MTRRERLRDLMWLLPPWAAFLFALGGYAWKWTRRFLLPGSEAVVAWCYGIAWWRCALFGAATAVVMSLPYSPSRYGPWMFAAVGALLAATPWLLAFRRSRWWWPVAVGVFGLALCAASLTWNWLMWKWAETLLGGLHGALVAWTVDRWQPEEG